jgi:expansin (peptidoglycan-binding protein)
VRRLFTVLVVGSAVLFSLACGDEETTAGGSSSTKETTGSSGPIPGGSGGGRPIASTPKDGIATFYDADGSGNCSFDKSPKDLDVTAMAMPEYADSASCGSCLLVKGPKGEITVRVVDSCPGCADHGVNLDLSAEAFAKIAEPKEGRISVTYQLVSCSVSGNLGYHFKDGSSQWWTAIQIRNHRVPIAKVEYSKNGSWIEMKREDYNYFVESDGVGTGDLTLRVTATNGQVIEDTVAGGVVAEKTVTGTKQFD